MNGNLTTVEVLFFGRVAETLGRELRIAIPAAGCTVAELRKRLAEADADAGEALGSGVRCSIDREIVGEDARVKPGQEIAFFPVFSGG